MPGRRDAHDLVQEFVGVGVLGMGVGRRPRGLLVVGVGDREGEGRSLHILGRKVLLLMFHVGLPRQRNEMIHHLLDLSSTLLYSIASFNIYYVLQRTCGFPAAAAAEVAGRP